MKIEDHKNNQSYQKAIAFANHNFGTPDMFVKKVTEYVEEYLSVDGYLSKSDYDLFCFYILSEISHNFSLAEMILIGKHINDEP